MMSVEYHPEAKCFVYDRYYKPCAFSFEFSRKIARDKCLYERDFDESIHSFKQCNFDVQFSHLCFFFFLNIAYLYSRSSQII